MPDSTAISRTEHGTDALVEGLRRAADYRGDVTIGTTDGGTVVGYLFDVVPPETEQGGDVGGDAARIRMLVPDADDPLVIPWSRVDSVALTGKDAAAGKSWEAWVRRYAKERYGIEPPDPGGTSGTGKADGS